MSDTFACRDAGRSYELVVGDTGADIDGRFASWLDVDDVTYDGHSLGFVLPDGTTLWARGLGARADECGARVRDLRGAARRPALTQSALSVVRAFESRAVTGESVAITDVLVFPHALTVEPRGGASSAIPLPLVRDVRRDGHALELDLRGLPPLTIRGLGARTDEFVEVLQDCRRQGAELTRSAYAEMGLSGIATPDGWAATPEDMGSAWPTALAVWRGQDRGAQLDVLTSVVGEGGLRLGLWTEAGTTAMPFALACTSARTVTRVAVEAVAADDRATFVFEASDVDALNAALVITAFRREAIALPDDELGRWATAVRTQPIVAWARQHVVARIVHDAAWKDAIRAALA